MAPHIPHRARAIQHRRREAVPRPQAILQYERRNSACAQPPCLLPTLFFDRESTVATAGHDDDRGMNPGPSRRIDIQLRHIAIALAQSPRSSLRPQHHHARKPGRMLRHRAGHSSLRTTCTQAGTDQPSSQNKQTSHCPARIHASRLYISKEKSCLLDFGNPQTLQHNFRRLKPSSKELV